MAYQMSRLTRADVSNMDTFKETNPGFRYSGNADSFHYYDVIEHIPVQRSHGQQASYAYRTNQMVKHSFEDGHMTLENLSAHTTEMNDMSDKEAFHYAKQHLNFN